MVQPLCIDEKKKPVNYVHGWSALGDPGEDTTKRGTQGTREALHAAWGRFGGYWPYVTVLRLTATWQTAKATVPVSQSARWREARDSILPDAHSTVEATGDGEERRFCTNFE
ncbi:unnamed protein product [Ixodes pacificus]